MKRPTRYFRCLGCGKHTARRWRKDPDRHLKAWTWDECGRWIAVSAASAGVQRWKAAGW